VVEVVVDEAVEEDGVKVDEIIVLLFDVEVVDV